MHWLAIGALLCMLLPIPYVMHFAIGAKFSPASAHVAAIRRNPELGGFNALTQGGDVRSPVSRSSPDGRGASAAD